MHGSNEVDLDDEMNKHGGRWFVGPCQGNVKRLMTSTIIFYEMGRTFLIGFLGFSKPI